MSETTTKKVYEDDHILITAPSEFVGTVMTDFVALEIVTLTFKDTGDEICLSPNAFLALGKSFIKFMKSEGVAHVKALRSWKDWTISKA